MRIMGFEEIGGRIAALCWNQGMDKHKIIVFDVEKEMKVEKSIDFTSVEFPEMRKLDEFHLLLITDNFKALVINIETNRIVKSSYPAESEKAVLFDVFPSGPSSPVFVGTFDDAEWQIKFFSLGKTLKIRQEAWTSTSISIPHAFFAMDRNHVFISDDKYFEIWRFRAGEKELVCSGKHKHWDTVFPLPLSFSENREENSRFVRELEKYNMSVPKDILGVVAGFI
jgi:hypothetical protein